MKTVGLLVLVVAVFVDKGKACSVSSPQCYKNTTRPDDDFLCEWEDRDYSPDAIYTIFMQSSSLNDSSYANQFDAGKKLSKSLPVENLITTRLLDIWVRRQVSNVTCSSPTISVFLNNSVKYSSPNIQQKIRSAEKFILSWPRVNDNKGAIHEIRWKKINDSWQNTTFKTEDGKNNGNWDSYTLQLQEHSEYQVQIRRKAKQSLLWSDWSQTADIPTEIPQPVVHWRENETAGKKGQRKITLRWKKPPPEASFGGVSYNLTLNLPCEKTKRKTIRNNTYKIAATYSEVRVSIVAINNVGSSPSREIIIPPRHLKYCQSESPTVPRTKHYCLEWYKLVDGETRPATVNISRSNTLEDIKKKSMERFVRYYYFIHTGRNERRITRMACPVYSTEGAPSSPPKNVTVLNITHDSAVLWWSPIPVQEQHGFLMSYEIWILREGHNDTGHHEVPANKTSFLLSSLDTGFSYTLSIAGRTAIGAGPNSTRIFFTLSPLSTYNGLKMAKIIISVCAVMLLFSVALSIAIRRLRSKLLPIIPSPVISAAVMPPMDNQNMKTMTEEVDNVILLCRDNQDKHGYSPKQKHSTLLKDHEFSVDEDEKEEDEDEENDGENLFTGFFSNDKPNFFPNPNYKRQLLRLPGSLEIADKSQMENCEVTTPSYKNSLFF